MKLQKIKKVFIANRGEIALRVMAACRELNLKTVSIYTPEEMHLAHATSADESYCLGEGPLKETYLNKKLIIDLALKCQADAIHPGYGFLSENAEFADLVEKAGLIFIGPEGRVMRLMGDKKGSKDHMQKLGVPVIPGYHGDNQDSSFLKEEAKKMGMPLLIKASAGGGGKGMRIVHQLSEFDMALESAKREAQNAFGDSRVLLERYITSPRHIEAQVLSDTHGNHFHLFERECSIQRRHQKIVEESPSPALTQEIRQKITETAVKITSFINYRGAGTIEFIYDEDGSFYFLEMNTRLQVEHPVTELVTGLDLVKLQILVADGQKLPLTQKEIKQNGHAIEVRVCAEDPDHDFMPSIGKIHYVGRPRAPHVRLDSGYRDGDEVSINFDPMLAKLIVWGASREEARLRLISALNDIPFVGLTTNRTYLQRILKTKAFQKGDTLTHFVKTYEEEIESERADQLLKEEEKEVLAQAWFWAKSQGYLGLSHSKDNSTLESPLTPWDRLNAFRN